MRCFHGRTSGKNNSALFVVEMKYLLLPCAQKQNHVLWASPSSLPDLGGKEEDDTRLMAEETASSVPPTIDEPDCYDTVCIELELHGCVPALEVGRGERAFAMSICVWWSWSWR